MTLGIIAPELVMIRYCHFSHLNYSYQVVLINLLMQCVLCILICKATHFYLLETTIFHIFTILYINWFLACV